MTLKEIAELLIDLENEADLCRNETAYDIAALLDRAIFAIKFMNNPKNEECGDGKAMAPMPSFQPVSAGAEPAAHPAFELPTFEQVNKP